MANSFVPVYVGATLDTVNKLDSESLTVGANTVHRERAQVAGASALEVARVMATGPVGTEMGLVARLAGPVPAGTSNIGDVDVLTLIPGTGAINLGKAIDVAAGASDTGVMVLNVRRDALITLTPIDGDFVPRYSDARGAQWVLLDHMPLVIGSVAHDSPDTQMPVKIGGFASAALRTAVSESDRVDASFDLQGQLRVLLGGGVAHDAADSGNPLKIGGRASTALRVAVAGNDRVDALFDADGALVTRKTAHANIVGGNASNTDGASTEVIAAQAAGIRTYITDIEVTNTHATAFAYVEIKDGTTVVQTIPVPPLGGAVVHYDTPLRGTANTAWNFDPSAATTTLICSMHGYTSLT